MAPEWRLPHWLPVLRAEEVYASSGETPDLCYFPVPCLPPPQATEALLLLGKEQEGLWHGGKLWRIEPCGWSLQLLSGKTY